jgi:G:T/U-mismatch repair DNA glycosylase
MLNAESHPLPPFLPVNAKLLLLGSFPPPKGRWKMNFYYPNLQNDMWRIFGTIFFENKDYFLTSDKKNFRESMLKKFLEEKGIALSDTASKVIRRKENASDKFLEIVETVNLENLLDLLPNCNTIATTGEKAAQTLHAIIAPGAAIPSPGNFVRVTYLNRSLDIWRMPSSSRAYPKPLEGKAAAYKLLFDSAQLL